MKKPKPLGRIVMIHGVKARDRERHALRRLAPAFRAAGFCVVMPSYGFLPAFVVGMFKWIDNRIADSMSAFIQPEDILLGHSNGGTLAYLITQKIKVRGCILLNPALDEKLLPNADFIHIYYNHGDMVTKLSALVPFNPWGAMGARGYRGKWDPRAVNIDQGSPVGQVPPLPQLNGHSDIFSVGKTRPWANFMASLALTAITLLNARKRK